MRLKQAIVLILFAVTAAITAFTNVERHAGRGAGNLTAIPTVVGNWRMIGENAGLGAKEENFLDDVLVRTYQRPDGSTVMLAVAYGADQRKNFSIHLPEICYKASGCSVTSVGRSVSRSPSLTMKQMLARRPDGGIEAVQYWVVLDGKILTSDFEKKLKHLYYSILGARTTGVLVRVSSITTMNSSASAYRLHNEFLSCLYASLDAKPKKLLFGDAL